MNGAPERLTPAAPEDLAEAVAFALPFDGRKREHDAGEFMTYDVALAFMRSEGGDIVACEPKEARSSNQAIRMADSLATTEGRCGAIAFSRTGDPALGDFVDAEILKAVGEVDSGLLAG